MSISPITYAENKHVNIPPTLLVHARRDNQVLYSNTVRLKTALDFTSMSHKLITPGGSANNHLLGGEIYSTIEPILYKNQIWVAEARNWMEVYILKY